MHLIVCIDERDGLSFCGRRLSRDSVLNQHMLKMTEGHALWMNAYSAKMFSGTDICEDELYLKKAAMGEYCFLENATLPETNENLENNFADESNNTSSVTGLSEAEKQDPNKIIVTIPNKKVPLVVLFGPPACGKTMTLVRLTRYLQSEGYIISPIREFRPSSDKNYDEICDNFDTMINSANAAASTNRVSFMLVDVLNKNGRSLCQILEAPGEHYFNPEKPRNGFPSYVNT